jgi:uncharacterized protein YecE (DUF72 family)
LNYQEKSEVFWAGPGAIYGLEPFGVNLREAGIILASCGELGKDHEKVGTPGNSLAYRTGTGPAAAMSGTGLIHIGTSGWHYDHWRGPFYPENLAPAEFLQFYQQKFHTVEINNSFYRLPSEKALIDWRESVPAGFIFAVKGSRFITHMKKLKDPEKSMAAFMERLPLLGDRLGPILFQLPPRWHFNGERLGNFLKVLPRDYRYALELRDPSWLNREACDLLREYGAAFCIYELAGRISPKEVTTDFAYIRLHGPGGAYQGRYDRKTLAGWASDISAWAAQGKAVFCYFDNDEAGYAAQNALELQEMLGAG